MKLNDNDGSRWAGVAMTVVGIGLTTYLAYCTFVVPHLQLIESEAGQRGITRGLFIGVVLSIMGISQLADGLTARRNFAIEMDAFAGLS
jgi:hypothetical protein